MSLEDAERAAVLRFLAEVRAALIADVDLGRAYEVMGTVSAYVSLVADDLHRKVDPESIHDRADLLVQAIAKLEG